MLPISIPRDDFKGRVALVKRLLEHTTEQYEAIQTYLTEEHARGKIENFVGAVPIPLGLCGPWWVRPQRSRRQRNGRNVSSVRPGHGLHR
jgi:hydroxymethylglutaryl-CoA reductase (NADPH)